MNHNGLLGGFYRLSEWVMKLAYANLLWIAFTLLGGILFGLMPATTALFTITRRWMINKDEDDFSVFKLFWSTYRINFFKSNLLGSFFIISAGILYIYFQNIHLVPDKYSQVFQIFLYSIVIAYSITVVFIFPVFVYFNGGISQYIKNSFVIGLSFPHYALYMLLLVGGIITIFLFIPSLLLFFGGSFLAFVTLKIASKVFVKIEERQELRNGHHEKSVV